MSVLLTSLFVRHEQDVVAVRQRAREIAARLGFEGQDQTRIATAISEIARNAFMYAGGGKVEFTVEGPRAPQLLVMRVSDRGPGIAGSRRRPRGPVPLLDRHGHRHARGAAAWSITSTWRVGPGRGPPSRSASCSRAERPRSPPPGSRRLATALAGEAPQSPLEEIRQQNQELLRTLDELGQRQAGSLPPERRAARHQPGRARPLRGAGREGGHPPARRRDEVAVPLEHEPRVPDAAQLDAGPLALAPRGRGAPAHRRAAAPGRLHPPGRRGSHRAGERPARPRQGRGGQDRDPSRRVRRPGPLRRAARHAAAPAPERVGHPRLRGAGRPARSCTPTRGRSRRSCATCSPTRSSSPSAARSG